LEIKGIILAAHGDRLSDSGALSDAFDIAREGGA